VSGFVAARIVNTALVGEIIPVVVEIGVEIVEYGKEQ
jgi:hypothetical protein